MEKSNEEIKEEWKKAIACGISVLCIYIAAMSVKTAVNGIILPYFWKIIGFDMNVAINWANSISSMVSIAFALALVSLISGSYLVKKMR